eukprot:746300-Hanusia_phi.AAC.4
MPRQPHGHLPYLRPFSRAFMNLPVALAMLQSGAVSMLGGRSHGLVITYSCPASLMTDTQTIPAMDIKHTTTGTGLAWPEL